MNRVQSFALLAVSILGVCTIISGNNVDNSSGFGYELLMAKLDYLEYKFLELQVESKEQVESLLENQNTNKRDLDEQISKLLDQQKAFANHERILNAIFELNPRKHPSDNSKLLPMLLNSEKRSVVTTQSCLEEESKRSGRYWLKTVNNYTFEVYCQQTFYGGGWIMVQNRFNGSVNFTRGWDEYKAGFGSLDGEFWLGLEQLHQLTSTGTHELLIHLEDFEGVSKYARYGQFAIAGENENYRLETLKDYSGTAGDSLSYHMNMAFSTPDRDNDKDDRHCAQTYNSAWWFNECYFSNLNGVYQKDLDKGAMSWYEFNENHLALKVSKIMIRKL